MNLEKYSLDGKDICGYYYFSMSLLEDNKFHFISKKDSSFYYIEQEFTTGKTSFVSSVREPLIFSLNDLLNTPLTMVNDGNLVNITQIHLLKLSGQFEAVNEDGSLVSTITLNTISTFNNYLKYYPSEIGVFSFSVSIYLKLSSDIYKNTNCIHIVNKTIYKETLLIIYFRFSV